jgi:hypothetical protein
LLQTIPPTVLAQEGLGSRAYLVMMAAAGFRPASIVAMISSHGEAGVVANGSVQNSQNDFWVHVQAGSAYDRREFDRDVEIMSTLIGGSA